MLLYRRRQVSEGKRHARSLTLLNLLELESFQADLGLIQMRRASKLDTESKIGMPPDAASRNPIIHMTFTFKITVATAWNQGKRQIKMKKKLEYGIKAKYIFFFIK